MTHLLFQARNLSVIVSAAYAYCIIFVLVGLAGCGAERSGVSVATGIDSNVSSGVTTSAEQIENGSEPDSSNAALQMEQTGFYTFGEYDKEASPAEMLKLSLERAKAEDKFVIVQAGGDWCVWCDRISSFMQSEEGVKKLLEKHFLVMKVHFPSDAADEFIKDLPQPDAYPHFYVFDEEGDFIHSQDTEELEEGEGYNRELFLKFLRKFSS